MLQLLDLAGIYFRAFFSTPSSVRSPDGRPMNAVRGTVEIIRRVIEDGRPTRVIACLDLDWRPQWRVDLVPSYKTHRVAEPGTAPVLGEPSQAEVIPDELSPQVPVLLEVLTALGITLAGAPEAEADDVIGTLCAAETRDPVEVVTGDRDLFQLARDLPTPVRVRYLGAGMSKMSVLGAAEVAVKHAIPVGRYVDFAVLRGDPSDGLPGVPGVGDKTAAQLLTTFGSLDGIIRAATDRSSGMSAGQRTKILAAADYLAVAPQVVRVADAAAVSVDPAGDGLLPDSPADPGALADLIRSTGIGSTVKRFLDTVQPGLG